MKSILKYQEEFVGRHIGISTDMEKKMLEVIGVNSIDELLDNTIPESIKLKEELKLEAPLSEATFLKEFKTMASKNEVFKSYIGMGYYDAMLPTVIQRNVLENPAWYTAYTPYQAEIAQGRLEALINFQTMICDLTGMEIANASLLDEGTAAAEAMTMLHRVTKKKGANKFFVDQEVFPQSLDVIIGRAKHIGIEVVTGDISMLDFSDPELYGIYVQYPDNKGEIRNLEPFIKLAQEHNVKTAVGTDLLALTLLKSPGEMGADVVLGSSQRFGIPLGYGGPHAAFFSTREAYKRQVPGRIIGLSEDKNGKPAYRMALQTREQHIKRDRATSNICTAQVLLAVMAGMYGVYHGKDGLLKKAKKVHALTSTLADGLSILGYNVLSDSFFDTIHVEVGNTDLLRQKAEEQQINFRYFEDKTVGISLNECTEQEDLQEILDLFASTIELGNINLDTIDANDRIPQDLVRTSDFMSHPVFSSYHSEHEMLRYLKRLENKDLSLVHSMIPLGSCTMKLNASTEMIPLTWAEWGAIHPFAPLDQTKGYHEMFDKLCDWLSKITGFHATSLQPNSGAQGELAGLLVIRAYFESINEHHRNITLIPSSAHGTNAASAVMSGQKVITVKCLENGDIDLEDLKSKAEKYSDNLMALMVTYPSTHGVFEESITEVCNTIHQYGGKVYLDGANMNAQIGLTSPGFIGADVCHLNLHKTFCIPHGGGGPGMGPIAVTKELAPFLPSSQVVTESGGEMPINAISAAPWGSASILTISYAYIAMMGAEGLKKSTEVAILSANYIQKRLGEHYPVLFKGFKGFNAHELIIDCRAFKPDGIEVVDIAKRLMDYGFHAPTVSFPVAGTLMIEPTESETLEELDRFCDAMISIRAEISRVQSGLISSQNSPLKNAPHTLAQCTGSAWDMAYSREEAAFPLEYIAQRKFWASVARIDDAYGDRNLMCSCPPVEEYENELTEV